MEPSKPDVTEKFKASPNQKQRSYVVSTVNVKLNSIIRDVKRDDNPQVVAPKLETNNCESFEEIRNELIRSDEAITKLKSLVAESFEDHSKATKKIDELNEIEKNYTEMGEELTKDIEKLEKELASLVVFCNKPQDVTKIIEGQKAQMVVQEAEHKEKMDHLKQLYLTQPEEVTKEIDDKLRDMSLKLQEQYEICKAGAFAESKANELKEITCEKDFVEEEEEEENDDSGNEKNISNDEKELVDKDLSLD